MTHYAITPPQRRTSDNAGKVLLLGEERDVNGLAESMRERGEAVRVFERQVSAGGIVARVWCAVSYGYRLTHLFPIPSGFTAFGIDVDGQIMMNARDFGEYLTGSDDDPDDRTSYAAAVAQRVEESGLVDWRAYTVHWSRPPSEYDKFYDGDVIIIDRRHYSHNVVMRLVGRVPDEGDAPCLFTGRATAFGDGRRWVLVVDGGMVAHPSREDHWRSRPGFMGWYPVHTDAVGTLPEGWARDLDAEDAITCDRCGAEGVEPSKVRDRHDDTLRFCVPCGEG